MNPEALFAKEYPVMDGIYYCLNDDARVDRIKKVEIATYSERAKDFDEQRMLHLTEEHQAILRPLMYLPKGSTVLEIAGGDGRFALHLMKNGYTVIESDIAPGSVTRVKEVAEKYNIQNGVYAVIDAEQLPFRDASLDAVFMSASLHHLPHPEKAIAEIYRCLKPGGYLAILREPASWQYTLFGPLYWAVRTLARKRNKNVFSIADDETKGFSPKEFHAFLKSFTNVRLVPVSYLYKSYYNFLRLVRKLTPLSAHENPRIKKTLQSWDRGIAKIPMVNHFPWDWDVYAEKP